MKKLCLLFALVASPVFAQEEEQEIQIEMESGGGVEVGIGVSDGSYPAAIAAFPDKSVWFRTFRDNDDDATYCWVDEDAEPRCKLVKVAED
jgi:hypothetical protein|tara:strand:- start:183 stop:455 length:273 start_codon:yes stop_codon:yes gene_type:complete